MVGAFTAPVGHPDLRGMNTLPRPFSRQPSGSPSTLSIHGCVLYNHCQAGLSLIGMLRMDGPYRTPAVDAGMEI